MTLLIERRAPRRGQTVIAGLSEQIALALEEEILLGKLQPGEHIVEADVAARLGTSNGPVREALRQLEDLGLVVCRPRRGTFVGQLTSQVAREVFSMRALLEVSALHLVLADLTNTKIRRFELALENMGSSLSEHGRAAWLTVDDDLRFHDLLFDLCGHRLLQQSWQRLRSQVRVLLIVTGAFGDIASVPIPERVASLRAVHEPIIYSLVERDAAGAERAIVRHLAEGERKIVRGLPGGAEEVEPLVFQLLGHRQSDGNGVVETPTRP
jgi:DNA-binding GntR family transcriptional regulator